MKTPSGEASLATLEQQVNDLATLCENLISANLALVERCDRMQGQQRDWQRKNRKAQDAIERVLTQLRPHGGAE